MMSEEFLNLQLDKPPSKVKSASELQKHVLDEKLDKKPVDRALFILSKGDDLQKLSVIESLPQLLDFDSNGTITKIIPRIQKELLSSSPEFNIITSQMYQILFKMQVPINFIIPIIQGIESRDSVVSGAWMETLLAILPELPEEILKTDVLRCAVARCQPTRSTYSRVTSCKLLGRICVHPHMSALQVQREILPLVHSLCQDCLYEIRAAICKELPFVATGISKLGEPVNMMPLLVELSNDENASVRAAAIDGLVLIVPLLTSNTVKTTIIPLFKQLCSKSTTQDDITYYSIAKIFGALIETLLGNLTPEDAVWFMDFYKHLCLTGSSEYLDSDLLLGTSCRAYCANDLPVMTVVMKRLLPQEISYWYKIFNDLANDTNSSVRKAVAQHFDTISEILGNKNKLLKPDFIRLLKDDSEEVLQSLVPIIIPIIRHFSESQLISREITNQASLDIGRALIVCKASVLKTNNYRLQVDLLVQLEKLPFYFNSEFIHKNFTLILFNVATKGKARPIRVQATRTLLVFLRHNINDVHRKWMRETMINELARSRSCYTRIIFVKMCEEALTVFSGKYFKEYFFNPLMALAEDPVCNIRLTVLKLCPKLKRILVLPIDKHLQVKLEAILSKLEITEQDRDVLFTLRGALKQMGTTQAYKSQEYMTEEKRKIEEEDSIQKGKLIELRHGGSHVGASMKAKPSAQSAHTARIYQKGTNKKESITGMSNISNNINNNDNMTFLDKHFYIDAGVPLSDATLLEPTNVEKDSSDSTDKAAGLDNLTSTTLDITNQNEDISGTTDTSTELVISAENTDIENLSEKDLKKLKITSNITDDVKVNLQKINQSKNLTPHSDSVKKRNKRLSCIFNNDRKECTNKNILLKRRSLNIGIGDTSRIPVSSRNSTLTKSKSESTNSLSSVPLKMSASNSRLLDINQVKTVLSNNVNVTKSKISLPSKDLKGNVQVENSSSSNMTKETQPVTKISNLPVLIRSPK